MSNIRAVKSLIFVIALMCSDRRTFQCCSMSRDPEIPPGSLLKENLKAGHMQATAGHMFSYHSFRLILVISNFVLVCRLSIRQLLNLYKLFSAIRTNTRGQVCTCLGCSPLSVCSQSKTSHKWKSKMAVRS